MCLFSSSSLEAAVGCIVLTNYKGWQCHVQPDVWYLPARLLTSAKLKQGHPPQHGTQECVMQIWNAIRKTAGFKYTSFKWFPRKLMALPAEGAARRGRTLVLFLEEWPSQPALSFPYRQSLSHPAPPTSHHCPATPSQNNCHPSERWFSHLQTGPPSVCACVLSCPTLCDPMDCSPPGSSVHGIFQARVLEWVAISFSRGSPQLKFASPMSPALASRFFTIWAIGEAQISYYQEIRLMVRSWDSIQSQEGPTF